MTDVETFFAYCCKGGIKEKTLGHTENNEFRKEKKDMSKKKKNGVRSISEEEYEEYVRSLMQKEK